MQSRTANIRKALHRYARGLHWQASQLHKPNLVIEEKLSRILSGGVEVKFQK